MANCSIYPLCFHALQFNMNSLYKDSREGIIWIANNSLNVIKMFPNVIHHRFSIWLQKLFWKSSKKLSRDYWVSWRFGKPLGISIKHVDIWDGQLTILLHKHYFVKVTTKGEGVKNNQKFGHVVYGWPPSHHELKDHSKRGRSVC